MEFNPFSKSHKSLIKLLLKIKEAWQRNLKPLFIAKLTKVLRQQLLTFSELEIRHRPIRTTCWQRSWICTRHLWTKFKVRTQRELRRLTREKEISSKTSTSWSWRLKRHSRSSKEPSGNSTSSRNRTPPLWRPEHRIKILY